jgi:hypothetical protein
MTLTNQNHIHKGIRSKLTLGNACYHRVQNLFSSPLLSKYVKIKIYKTIILAIVFYEYKTWSLELREDQRLRVFENSGLRKISGPKRKEIIGSRRKLHNQELHNLYSYLNIIRIINL